MSVWCSTIWMGKAIDIIFILLIHANGTVCSRCWEKKLQLFKDVINLGNNSRLSSVLCPTQRKPPNHQSISFYLCSCDQKEDATLQLDAQVALWEFLLRLWYFGVFLLRTFLVLVLMFISYLVVYIWYTTVMKPISFSWTIQRPLAFMQDGFDSQWSSGPGPPGSPVKSTFWFVAEAGFSLPAATPPSVIDVW